MARLSQDYVSKRPVRAVTRFFETRGHSDYEIQHHLPKDWILENGMLYFPAGFWVYYLVGGKDYNIDGDRTPEEQKEEVARDMAADGFTTAETSEFIQSLSEREGVKMLLGYEESMRWLRRFPRFETEARGLVKSVVDKLVEAESKKESKRARR